MGWRLPDTKVLCDSCLSLKGRQGAGVRARTAEGRLDDDMVCFSADSTVPTQGQTGPKQPRGPHSLVSLHP